MAAQNKKTDNSQDIGADQIAECVVTQQDITAQSEETQNTGRGGISRARTIVKLVVFIAIVIGLLIGAGIGGYSSLGWNVIAYICPLGALESFLAAHTIIPRALIALICVLVIVALLGRVFCAWVCPIPPLNRFFHPRPKEDKDKNADGNNVNEKVAVEAANTQPTQEKHACSGCASSDKCALASVGGKRDGFHFDSRYGVLLGALVGSLIFGFPVFCLVCPVGLTFGFVVCLYRAIFEQDPTVSILIFAAILIVEVVVFRKWCHKICPLGALMSLVGAKAPIARPRVNTKVCLRTSGVDCHVCVQVCPELLDPHSKSIPECTRCGLCVQTCPAQAIHLRKIRTLESGGQETKTEAGT